MSVIAATTRVACNVGAGNQNITTAKLGGEVPVAVFYVISGGITDATPAAHAVIGFGAATSTSERWAVSIQSEDGANRSDANRRGMTDECVMRLLGTGSAIDGEADHSAFIVNGSTINWGDPPAAANLLTASYFAGTAVQAKAGTFAMAAAQNGTVNTNVGFDPDVLIVAGHAMLFNDTSGTSAFFSYGVVKLSPSVEQYCIAWVSGDNKADAEVAAQIRNDYGIGWVTSVAGTLVLAGEFGTFANGFSCTTRLNPAGDGETVGYLALKFNGAVAFETGIIDSPVANGDETVIDPGFVPQYVHVGLTQMPAVNTAYANGNAGSIGVSVFDAEDAYCNSIQDEDAEPVTDTQSLSSDQVIDFPDGDGTQAHVATFVGMESEGWKWNFTATEGTAVKWWYLAIENQVPRHPAAYNTLAIY